MLKRLLRARGGAESVAERLYLALVAQARHEAFYRDCGAPDTVLGRFEMICLHAFLLFNRLKETEAAALAQEVHDVMFADMDRSLREMGIGDLGVGKRVKKLASNLYGRLAAYDAGLAEGDDALAAALRRNLFATVTPEDDQVAGVAAYVQREARRLAHQSLGDLTDGWVSFGPPPAADDGGSPDADDDPKAAVAR